MSCLLRLEGEPDAVSPGLPNPIPSEGLKCVI